MAKTRSFCILVLLIISLFSSSESRAVVINRNLPDNWCIANPAADQGNVQKDMDVLCNVVDCSSIKPGGTCFEPNSVFDHASVVFNKYYKARASEKSTCNFGGDAIVVFNNPSHGSCIFD